MLELIVEFLNLKVGLTSYFEVNHCLTTLVETDANEVYPAKYISNGNYEKINLDASDGASYIRLTDEPKTTRNAAKYTPKPKVDITFPMRFVYSVRRSKLTDDAYAQDRIRESLTKQIESDPDDLVISLGADNVRINVSGSLGGKKLWDEETANTGTYQPKTDIVYAALDFDVIVSVRVDCIPDECDFDTDILHSFDFCKAAVRARLTAGQITCLEDALCGTPAPSTVSVNGVDVQDVACGDTYNVEVQDTAGNAVGTGANPSVVDDCKVTINGSSLGATGSILAEATLDIDVTQSGSPVGSWNGSAWIIPPSTPFTISASIDDNTPTFGQSVTLTATGTGLSGVTWYADGHQIGTGTPLAWTVNQSGTYDIVAVGTDGTEYAEDTISVTASFSQLISTDANRHRWWDFSQTGTLTGDPIQTIADALGSTDSLTQASVGLRPARTTVNALTAATFDRTVGHYLERTGGSTTNYTEVTVIFVFKPTEMYTNTTDRLFSIRKNGQNDFNGANSIAVTNLLIQLLGGSKKSNMGTGLHVKALRMSIPGAYLNERLYSADSYIENQVTLTASQLGLIFEINRWGSQVSMLGFEWQIFTRILNDTECNQEANKLRWKWGAELT